MNLSRISSDSDIRLFPEIAPLNKKEEESNSTSKAVLGLYSRECSAELLARLTGSNCFVERPLAPEIIEAAEQKHYLLYITAPDLPDKDRVIDYYIKLKSQTLEEIERIKKRIIVLALDNDQPLWLSQKLAAPEATEARNFIAQWVSEQNQHGRKVELHTFEPSALIEKFAEELNLTSDQAPSKTLEIGSKYGAKQIFHDCGIDSPSNTKECRSISELINAISSLLLKYPDTKQLVLKLSSTLYGAGQGNALFDTSIIKHLDTPEEMRQQVQQVLTEDNIEIIDKKLGWQGFVQEIPKAGIIAEVYIEGEIKRSPSVQGVVNSDGTVKVLSVHEQRLAPNNQTYIGSFYPANEDYRDRVSELFKQIAIQAYTQGHVGSISVDFMCVRDSEDEQWRIFAIEINNRSTGTAHGFRIVKSLLELDIDYNSPELIINGENRVYLASDSIYKAQYTGLRPSQVIQAVKASKIHFDINEKKGVVLYMLSGLAYGKCGAVAIGINENECVAMQNSLYTILDELVSKTGSKKS